MGLARVVHHKAGGGGERRQSGDAGGSRRDGKEMNRRMWKRLERQEKGTLALPLV